MSTAGPVIDAEAFPPPLVAKIQGLIDATGATGEYVTGWEKILEALMEGGAAWKSRMPPDIVGVDPQNRSKMGVSASESHAHGAQILKAGRSLKKPSDAACARDAWEEPAEDGMGKVCLDVFLC